MGVNEYQLIPSIRPLFPSIHDLIPHPFRPQGGAGDEWMEERAGMMLAGRFLGIHVSLGPKEV